MTKQDICRVLAGALVLVVAIALGIGSIQLWNGAPPSWPDLVARDETVVRASRAIMLVALLMFVGGSAAIVDVGWGPPVATIATIVFVVGAFWANHVLFGDIRPKHTLPNLVVGAIVLVLLWIGAARAPAPVMTP